jgi:hypothetical protein
MRLQKIIQRRIRAAIGGVDFNGDVNAAVAANVGERSQTTYASTRSTVDSTTYDAAPADAAAAVNVLGDEIGTGGSDERSETTDTGRREEGAP